MSTGEGPLDVDVESLGVGTVVVVSEPLSLGAAAMSEPLSPLSAPFSLSLSPGPLSLCRIGRVSLAHMPVNEAAPTGVAVTVLPLLPCPLPEGCDCDSWEVPDCD